MKLKRPNIPTGPWQYSEKHEPHVRSASGMSTILFTNTSDVTVAKAISKAAAALPEVMDWMEGLHYATRNGRHGERDNVIHIQVEAIMLKMGYTKEEES